MQAIKKKKVKLVKYQEEAQVGFNFLLHPLTHRRRGWTFFIFLL